MMFLSSATFFCVELIYPGEGDSSVMDLSRSFLLAVKMTLDICPGSTPQILRCWPLISSTEATGGLSDLLKGTSTKLLRD